MIARVIPVGDDPWGVFRFLEGTPWGNFQIVTGTNLSHALHGYAKPMAQTLGVPPEVRLKRIPEGMRACLDAKRCSLYQAKNCQPCKQMPDCFIPIGVEKKELVATIARAWRDGYQIVVVEGPEFIL